jgi:hypothetical protein
MAVDCITREAEEPTILYTVIREAEYISEPLKPYTSKLHRNLR